MTFSPVRQQEWMKGEDCHTSSLELELFTSGRERVKGMMPDVGILRSSFRVISLPLNTNVDIVTVTRLLTSSGRGGDPSTKFSFIWHRRQTILLTQFHTHQHDWSLLICECITKMPQITECSSSSMRLRVLACQFNSCLCQYQMTAQAHNQMKAKFHAVKTLPGIMQ